MLLLAERASSVLVPQLLWGIIPVFAVDLNTFVSNLQTGDLRCGFFFFKGQNYNEFNLFYCTSFKVRGSQHLFLNRRFKL